MEIKIPKEIRNYHESVFFGLSTRQFVCSLLAVGTAVALCFFLNPMLRSQISDTSNSFIQERYLTISVLCLYTLFLGP